MDVGQGYEISKPTFSDIFQEGRTTCPTNATNLKPSILVPQPTGGGGGHILLKTPQCLIIFLSFIDIAVENRYLFEVGGGKCGKVGAFRLA